MTPAKQPDGTARLPDAACVEFKRHYLNCIYCYREMHVSFARRAMTQEEYSTAKALAEAVLETPNWVKAAVQTAHDAQVYSQWNRITELARQFQREAGGGE